MARNRLNRVLNLVAIGVVGMVLCCSTVGVAQTTNDQALDEWKLLKSDIYSGQHSSSDAIVRAEKMLALVLSKINF